MIFNQKCENLHHGTGQIKKSIYGKTPNLMLRNSSRLYVILQPNKISENNPVVEKVFWANSTKVPCQGVGPMNCIQVQEGTEIEEGKRQNFYTAIDGIDYKLGNIYRIKVNVEQIFPPIPAEVSNTL